MPDYLPLCAFRQDLLPAECSSCAWWFSSGPSLDSKTDQRSLRRQWMAALEPTWGSSGLILSSGSRSRSPVGPVTTAAVHYAPVQSIPRLRDLPLGPLPPEAILLFCLRTENGADWPAARRLLQKALAQLRMRHVEEVYAYAVDTTGQGDGERCEFFIRDFLEGCGFKVVRDDGELFLMRTDLRGLVGVLGRAEAAIKRALGVDPAPSPATWTHRGT